MPTHDVKSPTNTGGRGLLVVSMLLAYMAVYSERSHVGVTLIAMLNSTFVVHHQYHQEEVNLTRRRAECKPFPRRDDDTGEFSWNSHEQGVVLASFYYGHAVTQLVTGCLSLRRLSARCLLLCGSMLTCVITLLTPVMTLFGDVIALVVARVVAGVGQGVMHASSNTVLSHWSSPGDASCFNALIYSGAQLGTIISLPLSAVLCHFVGWQVVFYAVGGMAALSWLLMLCLVHERPVTHLPISAIDTSDDSRQLDKKLESVKVPWNDILRSGPVLSLVFSHFANNSVHYTLLSCLPLYFHFVLRFNLIVNSLLCCLTFSAMWVVMVLGGMVAERLRARRTLSTTSVRKLFCAAGFLLPAACFVGAAFVGCNAVLSVFLIVVAASLLGLSASCWAVNHLDLAPPFAGELMNFSNAVATVPGVLAPSIVGAFLYEYPAYSSSWRNIFFIMAGVLVVATLVFWMTGSGQRQWWAIYVEMPSPGTDAPPAAPAAASDAGGGTAAADEKKNADEQRLATTDRTKVDSERDDFDSLMRQQRLLACSESIV